MRPRLTYRPMAMLVLVGLFFQGVALARGLDELAPATPNETQGDADAGDHDANEVGGENEGELSQPAMPQDVEKEAGAVEKQVLSPPPEASPEELSAKPAPEPSELSKVLRDRLSLGTSMGLSLVYKDGDSWRGSGVSDVTLAYKLQQKLAGGDLAASLRYAAMDLAPELKVNADTEAYRGIMEAYLIGASWQRSLQNSLQVVAELELGPALVSLNDQLNLLDEQAPDDTGFLLTIGGAAMWELLPRFSLGPKLRLGLGTFTTVQLSGAATFAF